MADSVFERKEIKYILTEDQRLGLLKEFEGRMEADKYGLTPTAQLIRESIE